MDDESGYADRDELRSGWRANYRQDWWRRRIESESWLQRRGDAYV